jgi:hypothetical protein
LRILLRAGLGVVGLMLVVVLAAMLTSWRAGTDPAVPEVVAAAAPEAAEATAPPEALPEPPAPAAEARGSAFGAFRAMLLGGEEEAPAEEAGHGKPVTVHLGLPAGRGEVEIHRGVN